ncbi:MAG: hypothetical protein NUV84_01120, partial [Candidatus Uhrbacteria bacterium]|nr:hypothetical protein [Candidatus Uhrbacteria bacterium]
VEIGTYSLSMTTREFYDENGVLSASNGSDIITLTNISDQPIMLRFFADIPKYEDGGFSLIFPRVYPLSYSYRNGVVWSTTDIVRPGESYQQDVMFFTSHQNPPGESVMTGTQASTLDLVVFDESGMCAFSRYQIEMEAQVTDINPPDGG